MKISIVYIANMTTQESAELIHMLLEKNEIEQAETLKRQIFPKTLYKYKKLDSNAINGIIHNSLWLSTPENLNDPYDCLISLNFEQYIEEYFSVHKFEDDFYRFYNVRLTDQEVIEIRNSQNKLEAYQELCAKKSIDKYIQKPADIIRKEIVETLQKNRPSVYLGCLSEICDSILMWSHYADNGKGICIEYSNIPQKSTFPVAYSNRLPTFSLSKKNIPTSFLIKAKDWSYESEWRIVRIDPNNSEKFNQNHKIVAPSRIFLGPRFNQNDKNVIENLRLIADFSKIELVQLKLHYEEFRLV
ncbi:MAG: DUF2971 domain-containing protein [Flavipsychrobacter sp.]|nr:DUF2971 domain-containing protein [Flavipsychrobacter sp.]